MDNYLITTLSLLPFSVPKISSLKRIGPHNLDILSILFGSLLGDGSAVRPPNGGGTFIRFYQSNDHAD